MITPKPYVTVVSVGDSGLSDDKIKEFLDMVGIKEGSVSGVWLYDGGIGLEYGNSILLLLSQNGFA